MRDDDDIWFDSLAGSTVDEPDKAAATARAIRAAILARAGEEPAAAGENLRRENDLVARARAEGLLPAQRVHVKRRWPAFLAAAAIAGLAIGLTLHMRTEAPAPVTRGSPAGIARITDKDPKQLQQELIRELKAAGVRASGYESFGRQGVDADLPTPLPGQVREILARHGITPPADNVLQLEIEPAP